MLKNIKQLFASPPFRDEAQAVYVSLVAQSRLPWFYADQSVPDTVDGRFDLMVLHMFLLLHRLRREESADAGEFIRSVSEAFFADMDRSLREMGSTDTGVGIRVKNMAQAFYGRMQAYEQSLLNPEALLEAIKRNLYRGTDVGGAKLEAIAAYIGRNVASLGEQKIADILSGEITFID